MLSIWKEEGSHIIKCSSEEQVNSVGTQLFQQTSVSQIKMYKITGVGNAVYTVEENGQIKDSSGNVVNQNNFPVRTTSIKEEIKQFEEKVDERIKAKQEEESKPVYVPQPEPEKVVEKKSESSKDNNKEGGSEEGAGTVNPSQGDIIESATPTQTDDDKKGDDATATQSASGTSTGTSGTGTGTSDETPDTTTTSDETPGSGADQGGGGEKPVITADDEQGVTG